MNRPLTEADYIALAREEGPEPVTSRLTPAYLAARVESRERRARMDYRTARSLYRAHQWSDAQRRAEALRHVLVARGVWNFAYELLREPSWSEQRVVGIDAAELAVMAGRAS